MLHQIGETFTKKGARQADSNTHTECSIVYHKVHQHMLSFSSGQSACQHFYDVEDRKEGAKQKLSLFFPCSHRADTTQSFNSSRLPCPLPDGSLSRGPRCADTPATSSRDRSKIPLFLTALWLLLLHPALICL